MTLFDRTHTTAVMYKIYISVLQSGFRLQPKSPTRVGQIYTNYRTGTDPSSPMRVCLVYLG